MSSDTISRNSPRIRVTPHREPYAGHAGAKLLEHTLVGQPGAASALAWANPDAEYPGAVTFESVCSTPRPPSYHTLSNAEIGDRLYEAWRIANNAHKGRPVEYPEPSAVSSSSTARPNNRLDELLPWNFKPPSS